MLQLEDALSSRPKRTQISYLVALAATTYAAFRRERRMKFASATKFHRKSGGAKRRDLRFSKSPTEANRSSTQPTFRFLNLTSKPESGPGAMHSKPAPGMPAS